MSFLYPIQNLVFIPSVSMSNMDCPVNSVWVYFQRGIIGETTNQSSALDPGRSNLKVEGVTTWPVWSVSCVDTPKDNYFFPDWPYELGLHQQNPTIPSGRLQPINALYEQPHKRIPSEWIQQTERSRNCADRVSTLLADHRFQLWGVTSKSRSQQGGCGF